MCTFDVDNFDVHAASSRRYSMLVIDTILSLASHNFDHGPPIFPLDVFQYLQDSSSSNHFA